MMHFLQNYCRVRYFAALVLPIVIPAALVRSPYAVDKQYPAGVL
jgi:hypothetical protein